MAAVGSRSIPELEKAIQQAQTAGLTSSDWGVADKVLKDEKSKEAARKALMAAVGSRSIPELEKAIQQAQTAGLTSSDWGVADKVLKDEKSKERIAAEKKAAEEAKK